MGNDNPIFLEYRHTFNHLAAIFLIAYPLDPLFDDFIIKRMVALLAAACFLWALLRLLPNCQIALLLGKFETRQSIGVHPFYIVPLFAACVTISLLSMSGVIVINPWILLFINVILVFAIPWLLIGLAPPWAKKK